MKRNSKFKEIEPDEIFLDAENAPDFNTNQLEGRITKPINKKTIFSVGLVCLLIGLTFIGRLGFVQIAKGQTFFDLSERNRLQKIPIISPRGIVYDRNGVELAWNREEEDKIIRSYIDLSGFAHLLGFVGYPTKDKAGFYWQDNFIGKSGIEKQYNDTLAGQNGMKITETDVFGNIKSENILAEVLPGDNVYLSLDARLQNKLFESIRDTAGGYFTGGAGVLIDVTDGSVLSLVSFPEFDSEVLSLGQDTEAILRFNSDKRKIFLNRPVSGLYTPGSTVKPFFATAALKENIITPDKKILSTGSISVPNPYNPNQASVFKDWKAHGFVNLAQAIAVSSNVYFYEIGGGFEGQPGLGISRLEKYARLFGLGEKTNIDLEGETLGTIPNPTWKKEHFNGEIWRVGDTYYTAIGQYGFQVTPLQLARAIAAVANNGRLLTPHLIKDKTKEEILLPIEDDIFQEVKNGMRMTVVSGTATSLNFGKAKFAAKTGTAQLGVLKERMNSWIIGFAPYENPKFAFVILLENGPENIGISAQMAAYKFFSWMVENTPEYFQ
ncbi:hypothetical protein A2645_01845 [Candidatus Nomurabacteria bacterium RIFCSPHIGHO2_01_FULL_39_9]|uniref:Penicillin-binding protein 2 n=1 Tax=Candidatus Nomurabacteria bacterium RIFCSPHIGHO2_01_FULL_39_9 TaxID=1801735 RepID=A0A1F6UX54_9BACT|nr:MAG: hypothetical protein A2645_01845 [Candidatus Nomurabacteria bacterium RIFCSPHIGHO2_01_FULL_39_9]